MVCASAEVAKYSSFGVSYKLTTADAAETEAVVAAAATAAVGCGEAICVHRSSEQSIREWVKHNYKYDQRERTTHRANHKRDMTQYEDLNTNITLGIREDL